MRNDKGTVSISIQRTFTLLVISVFGDILWQEYRLTVTNSLNGFEDSKVAATEEGKLFFFLVFVCSLVHVKWKLVEQRCGTVVSIYTNISVLSGQKCEMLTP